MTMRLAHIWRHPIKSHGREELNSVALEVGMTMPGDRRWAVAHEAAKADGSDWAPCVNFSRGAKAPALMAISSSFDEASGQITLTHPDQDGLTFDPDVDADRFLEWVAPLMPADRAASARILRVPDRGMTDTDYPSVSLLNLASNAALQDAMGQEISPLRWRGNLWFEGEQPWSEFELIGKRLRVGEVELEVRERIKRCLATTANPATGRRDAATLDTLQSGWGHTDFGVYTTVVKAGTVRVGDLLEVLS